MTAHEQEARNISREKEFKRGRAEAARPKSDPDINLRADAGQDTPDFNFRNVRDAPLTAEDRQKRRQNRVGEFEISRVEEQNHPEETASAPQEQPVSEYPSPTKEVKSEPFWDESKVPKQHTTQQHGTEYQRRFQESEKSEKQPSSTSCPDEPPRPSKLNFTADELPPDSSSKTTDKKLTRAQHREMRVNEKLERAEKRLPTRRKLRMETSSNPDTGKVKKRLRFEKQVKSQSDHVKGALPTRPLKAGLGTVGMMLHRQVYQSEHENIGLEAAHRTEMVGEGAVRGVYRYHKTVPYRKVSRLQKRAAKARVNAAYQQALQENPQLKKKMLAKMWQKKKLKRQYAKAAREAQRAGKRAKKTAVTTEKIAVRVVQSIRRHPIIWGIIILLLLLLFLISSVLGSFSGISSGGAGMIVSTTYLSADRDIDQAELIYTEWETDLQMQINNAAASRPGYDEYRYQVDEIGHDPYELMSYLTAVYRNFTFSSVQRTLKSILNDQYKLSIRGETEIRYRKETWKNPITGTEYEVEVPYLWRILNIQLTTNRFSSLVKSRMTAEQKEAYDVLIQGKGNRQYIRNVFDFDWSEYVSSRYGYRIHNSVKNYHSGVDIAVPEGTAILAGHDGKVTLAGDTGDFGLCVVLEGEVFSGQSLTTKYGHCSELLVSVGQTVKAGDVIAKVGNTGNSAIPHLHLEILVDGQYLNPLYFATSGY